MIYYKHEWKKALDGFHSTNNLLNLLEEYALLREACTLNLTDKPVSIKSIECSVDYGWEKDGLNHNCH